MVLQRKKIANKIWLDFIVSIIENSFCITDKSNSSLYTIFYNISKKIRPLKDISKAFKRLFWYLYKFLEAVPYQSPYMW